MHSLRFEFSPRLAKVQWRRSRRIQHLHHQLPRQSARFMKLDNNLIIRNVNMLMCFIRSLHPLILWKASADRPRTAAKLRITRLLGRCDTDELLALETDLKEMVSGRESHGASRPDAPNPTGSKDPQKECKILRWPNDLSNTFPCEKFDQAFCRPKSTTENLLLIVNVRFLKNNAILFFDKIDDVRRFFF